MEHVNEDPNQTLLMDCSKRDILRKQTYRRVHYIKHRNKSRRENLPFSCKTVGEFDACKKHYTLQLSSGFTNESDIDSLNDVKELGKKLYNNKLLTVWDTDDVQASPQNAFQMMTVLSPNAIKDDDEETEPEKELRSYLGAIIKNKEAQEKTEGKVLENTMVFTSLSLLYNIVECRKLDYELCIAADGTDLISKLSFYSSLDCKT